MYRRIKYFISKQIIVIQITKFFFLLINFRDLCSLKMKLLFIFVKIKRDTCSLDSCYCMLATSINSHHENYAHTVRTRSCQQLMKDILYTCSKILMLTILYYFVLQHTFISINSGSGKLSLSDSESLFLPLCAIAARAIAWSHHYIFMNYVIPEGGRGGWSSTDYKGL